jgi:hypothetical protein
MTTVNFAFVTASPLSSSVLPPSPLAPPGAAPAWQDDNVSRSLLCVRGSLLCVSRSLLCVRGSLCVLVGLFCVLIGLLCVLVGLCCLFVGLAWV